MHQRSFNIRIFNFHLEGESNDTRNVMNQVYEKIMTPVLEGAVSKGRLAAVPAVDSLLETAHILPGKEGKPKPIICRFFNRFHRMLFLQLKKEFAPRGQPKSPSRSPPYLYPPGLRGRVQGHVQADESPRQPHPGRLLLGSRRGPEDQDG
jgi:hypothetical protein